MAYDPTTKTVVLLGGEHRIPEGGAIRTDMWTWNGSEWRQEHPTHLPTAWPQAPLAFDPTTNLLTMLAPTQGSAASDAKHGTFNGNGSETFTRWTWDGRDWTEREDGGPAPPLSFGATFLWDAPTHHMLYFSYQPYMGSCPPSPERVACGHADPTGTYYSQTWTWDGQHWARQFVRRAPAAYEAAFADPITATVTIVGPDHRTWSWTGKDWQRANVPTPAPSYAVAASDPPEAAAIVLGSDDSTMWIYAARAWQTIAPRS
jgi:hypothetical protein